jgi:hypothetical protein
MEYDMTDFQLREGKGIFNNPRTPLLKKQIPSPMTENTGGETAKLTDHGEARGARRKPGALSGQAAAIIPPFTANGQNDEPGKYRTAERQDNKAGYST